MHLEDHAANRKFGDEHRSSQCPDSHCEGRLILESDGHWYCYGITRLDDANAGVPCHRQVRSADDDKAWHSVCRISPDLMAPKKKAEQQFSRHSA